VIRSRRFAADVSATLEAILATEITPELVPTKAGETPQSTEASIGPYALQDFTLYYTLRHGMVPSKIAFLALHAWGDVTRGDWPPGFPPERRGAYDSAGGSRCSCGASSRSASSSVRPCRTGRR
jgi:NAD+ synthase (glutamine-hydrolysing)